MSTPTIDSEESAFLGALGGIFPGVSSPVAVFLALTLVVGFVASFAVGIYFAIRFVRRSTCSCDNPIPQKTIVGYHTAQLALARSISPNSTFEEMKITTDIEASSGIKVNGATESEMMAAMSSSVRGAYLRLVGENKPRTPVEPMFPEGPRRKCKELKDEVCEYGCFCRSAWGQIAGYGGRESQSNTNVVVNSVVSSSQYVRPPTPAPSRSRDDFRLSNVSNTSSWSSGPYVVTPVIPMARPDSSSSLDATASYSSSWSSRRFSDNSSIITPHAPILQVRNAIPWLDTSPSSSTSSPVNEDAIRFQTTPTPASKQQRASAPAGVRPLLLVKKVKPQRPYDTVEEERTPAQRRVLGEISNRSSTVSYSAHNATLSRAVKTGGKRHRDMRPVTLGY